MKYSISLAVLLGAFIAHVSAALSDDDIIRLMDEKPVEGYNIDPTEHGLPPSSSGFIILNYDDAVIEGVWKILENPEQQRHWKQAYRSLRRIAAADPNSIDYDRLVGQIKVVEESENIGDENKISLLMLGYPAVARHRDDHAFEFLKRRTEFEFWEGNEISKTVYNSHGAGSDGILQTGQSMAINAISELQTEAAYALLQSLFSNKRYTSEPHLNIVLSSCLQYGGWEASASRLQTIQAEYAKRQKIRGISALAQVNDESAVDVRSAAEAVEAIEEVAAPESVIGGPTEVATSAHSEEPAEQSPQWWLWLIGAVIVLGGFGIVVQRKS